jgi:hypothetical protein
MNMREISNHSKETSPEYGVQDCLLWEIFLHLQLNRGSQGTREGVGADFSVNQRRGLLLSYADCGLAKQPSRLAIHSATASPVGIQLFCCCL